MAQRVIIKAMELEVKELTDTAQETQTTLADAATGVVIGLATAAGHPVRTVRNNVRKLERKGAPVNRKLDRNVKRAAAEAVDFTEDVVDGTLPERIALQGIHILKDRARRRDTVGDLLFRGLELVNGNLDRYLRTVQRFDRATEPPVRNGAGAARRSTATRTPAGARSEARTSARKTARRAKSTARSARTTARRTATAVRKSA